jgi:anti-sigma B factor antagonist
MKGLTLNDELTDGVWFVGAQGYLDANTAEDLDNLIAAIFDQGVFKLAIDLSGVSFMSSAGAGILMVTHKQADTEGGGAVFVNPSEQVLGVFKVLGLGEIFTVVSSREAAIARFGG